MSCRFCEMLPWQRYRLLQYKYCRFVAFFTFFDFGDRSFAPSNNFIVVVVAAAYCWRFLLKFSIFLLCKYIRDIFFSSFFIRCYLIYLFIYPFLSHELVFIIGCIYVVKLCGKDDVIDSSRACRENLFFFSSILLSCLCNLPSFFEYVQCTCIVVPMR